MRWWNLQFFTGSHVLSVEVREETMTVTISPVTTTDTATASPVKPGSQLGVEQMMFPFTVVDK